MYPASAENFKIGKGGLYIADWLTGTTQPDPRFDGLRVGNCTNVSLEAGDAQVLEKYSSTQNNSPLADRRNLRQSFSVLAQCDEHTYKNLEKFFLGNLVETTQSALTNQSAPISDVVQGGTYNVGARNISNVTVTIDGSVPGTEGVDYDVLAGPGQIYVRPGGGIDDGMDLVVEYDRAAISKTTISGGTNLNRFVKAVFVSDDANTDGKTAKGVLTVWKAQVAPEGPYGFVSDEYGNYSLRFTAVLDDINHASELFKIEYPQGV